MRITTVSQIGYSSWNALCYSRPADMGHQRGNPTSAVFICLVRSNPASSSLNICMQPAAMSQAGIHAPVTILQTQTAPPLALLRPRDPSSPAIFPVLSIPPHVLRHRTRSNKESSRDIGRQDFPNASQPKCRKRRAADCPERLYPEIDPVRA